MTLPVTLTSFLGGGPITAHKNMGTMCKIMLDYLQKVSREDLCHNYFGRYREKGQVRGRRLNGSGVVCCAYFDLAAVFPLLLRNPNLRCFTAASL